MRNIVQGVKKRFEKKVKFSIIIPTFALMSFNPMAGAGWLDDILEALGRSNPDRSMMNNYENLSRGDNALFRQFERSNNPNARENWRFPYGLHRIPIGNNNGLQTGQDENYAAGSPPSISSYSSRGKIRANGNSYRDLDVRFGCLLFAESCENQKKRTISQYIPE
jgi:hypothetical protein